MQTERHYCTSELPNTFLRPPSVVTHPPFPLPVYPLIHAQVYLDNRKSAHERELEGPSRAAELLLARGVKTVVSVSAATVPSANLAMLTGLLDGLAAGLSVGEAVWSSMMSAPPHELPHLNCNLMVHGAPHLKCVLAAGKKGSKKK